MNKNNHKQIDGSEFISLMTANQSRIHAYILTLVPNRSDADDILQETTATMWENKGDFIPGTDFVAWGARIAYYKILDYRKKVNKDRRMVLNDEQFKHIEEQALDHSKRVNEMIYKLEECAKKLAKSDRQFLQLKYSLGLSAKEISSRINKNVRSVYLDFSRIHGLLLRCIERYDQ